MTWAPPWRLMQEGMGAIVGPGTRAGKLRL